MKNAFQTPSVIKLCSVLLVSFIMLSWQADSTKTSESKDEFRAESDTSAPKFSHSDQADLQLNLDSVMQQVNIALSKIDYDKINSDVQKAIAQVDYNKINKEINQAMKNINWNEMKMNVAMALDSAKMAINNIDWKEIQNEVKKGQLDAKQQMELHKINSDSIKMQVQKSLKEAQKSLQAAQAEIAVYHALPNALKKDGLIEKNKPYTIQLKDGNLYINGAKQSKAITEKYSKYYSGKKNFTIADEGKDEADL